MVFVLVARTIFVLCLLKVCSCKETLIDYYENLILTNVEKSKNYQSLTSSDTYRPGVEGSPIGKL